MKKKFKSLCSKMDSDEIKHVNSTYRKRFAENAVVPKIVKSLIRGMPPNKKIDILDFGCGKDGVNIVNIPKNFHNVTMVGWDIDKDGVYSLAWLNSSVVRCNYHYFPYDRDFDIAFASNVFNTHVSAEMSVAAIENIYLSLRRGGLFIFNMPESPRYFWKDHLEDFLYLVNGSNRWRFMLEL